MRVLSANEVETEVLIALGFGSTSYRWDSHEVLAEMARRAAGYLCPCSARSLTNAVLEPLVHMAEDRNLLQTTIETVVEGLLAIGDIQEHKNVYPSESYLLYLAPPSYVPLSGGMIVVLGIAPDNTSFLPDDVVVNFRNGLRYIRREPLPVAIDSQVSVRNIEGKVENYTITSRDNADPSAGLISVESPIAKGLLGKTAGDRFEIETPLGAHVVTIVQVAGTSSGTGDDDLIARLAQLGLVRLSEEYWLNAPSDETAGSCISRFEHALERTAECADIPEIRVLDTARSVRYYHGRWSAAKHLSGRYIGRRPQSYGNDIWCFLEIEEGIVKRFLDLPPASSTGLRGCDEAWRLQAALDAHSGKPQQYKLSRIEDGVRSIDMFSPIPSWMERRWNLLGERKDEKGCLMSFQFREQEVSQELDFLRRKLWWTD